MPLPAFAPPAEPARRPAILNRTQAAARLGLNGPGVDKLMDAGVLTRPIHAVDVDELARREDLRIVEGELTVLRTGARAEADPSKHPQDHRRWVGFHVDHTDEELAESSLRWWRCDPQRVVDNELLVVTIATFPVAVYRILGLSRTTTRHDENTPRHAFDGQLVSRMRAGMTVHYEQNTPGHLRLLARQIMNSRVRVNSGGPIGYLEIEEGV